MDSEGGRLKGTRFSVGSGSPYAYGVLDNGYVLFLPLYSCYLLLFACLSYISGYFISKYLMEIPWKIREILH